MSVNDLRQPAMFRRSRDFGTHFTNAATLSALNDVHEMLKFSNLQRFWRKVLQTEIHPFFACHFYALLTISVRATNSRSQYHPDRCTWSNLTLPSVDFYRFQHTQPNWWQPLLSSISWGFRIWLKGRPTIVALWLPCLNLSIAVWWTTLSSLHRRQILDWRSVGKVELRFNNGPQQWSFMWKCV